MNDLISKLSVIDTPTLANAIELLRVRNRISGFCNRTMRCLFPELGILCGFAVTAEVETMSPDADTTGVEAKSNFIELCSALEAAPRPPVVVLKESGPCPDFSAHCGEVMATVFKRLGAVGVVSDSAVRDIEEVRSLKVRYFAPGTVASHGNFRIVRTGIPITVCGLSLEQDDLLHGDINGLIKVPREFRERLPEMVEKVRRSEGALLEYIKSDAFTVEGLKDRLTH